MTVSIAILRPQRDGIERALGDWAKIFRMSIYSDHRYSLACDLVGSALARSNLQQNISGANVVMFFGHGTPSALGNPTVIDDAEGPLLAQKIIVGLACEAAKHLGVALVRQHGAKAC